MKSTSPPRTPKRPRPTRPKKGLGRQPSKTKPNAIAKRPPLSTPCSAMLCGTGGGRRPAPHRSPPSISRSSSSRRHPRAASSQAGLHGRSGRARRHPGSRDVNSPLCADATKPPAAQGNDKTKGATPPPKAQPPPIRKPPPHRSSPARTASHPCQSRQGVRRIPSSRADSSPSPTRTPDAPGGDAAGAVKAGTDAMQILGLYARKPTSQMPRPIPRARPRTVPRWGNRPAARCRCQASPSRSRRRRTPARTISKSASIRRSSAASTSSSTSTATATSARGWSSIAPTRSTCSSATRHARARAAAGRSEDLRQRAGILAPPAELRAARHAGTKPAQLVVSGRRSGAARSTAARLRPAAWARRRPRHQSVRTIHGNERPHPSDNVQRHLRGHARRRQPPPPAPPASTTNTIAGNFQTFLNC